jgi:hypothetical protein
MPELTDGTSFYLIIVPLKITPITFALTVAVTLSIRTLHHRDRLVLMGSMSTPLPLSYMDLMANSWEIIGNFMYSVDAYRRQHS